MTKFLILLFCFLFQINLGAVPAQIIVIRHGEKDRITRNLTKQGEERATALAYYLTSTSYLLNYGLPKILFASRQINGFDRRVPRTLETMMPTGEYLELPVHSPFNGFQTQEMANFIMNNPAYDGWNMVICWNHSSIHDLLNAFGYQAPFRCTSPNRPYPDCRFDLTFVMTFPAPPPPSGQLYPNATVYYQQLMYGDITCQTIPPYPPTLPAEECSCNDPASCSEICDVICPSVG